MIKYVNLFIRNYSFRLLMANIMAEETMHMTIAPMIRAFLQLVFFAVVTAMNNHNSDNIVGQVANKG
jgi:hypothetical protein